MRAAEVCKAPAFMGKVRAVDVNESRQVERRDEKPAERCQVSQWKGKFQEWHSQ